MDQPTNLPHHERVKNSYMNKLLHMQLRPQNLEKNWLSTIIDHIELK